MRKKEQMRKLLILFFTSIILISCSNNKLNKVITNKENDYTWNVQLAGYDYDKYDEKGQTNYAEFITEFDKFPWIDQIKHYQKVQEGCSATLSVNNKESKTSFWVSIMGDVNNNTFLVGYIYPKRKKNLLRIGKEEQIKWLEIFIAEDKEQIKKYYQLYFSNKLGKLESELKKLQKYGEMEAQN